MVSHSLPYAIRPMEPADVPAVVAIDRLSFPTPWQASSYLYELRHNTQSFYYSLLKPALQSTIDEPTHSGQGWLHRLRSALRPVEESQVIGYVGLRLNATEAHVSTIAVHPDWRGKGLGELLLLTAMEKAVELLANVVSLEVRPSNQVAQHLYHKYGFRFMGIRRGYYRDGEDAWLMEVDANQGAYPARLTEMRHTLESRLRFQRTGVGQNDGDTL